MKELILAAHEIVGVLGMLAAVWVIAELNASQVNHGIVRRLSMLVAHLVGTVWILGGVWYVVYYAADRGIILHGPWPAAHGFFMECKEHLFFIPLVLAFYLPIAARENLLASAAVRRLAATTAALVVIASLAVESSGIAVGLGTKMGLAHAAAAAGIGG